MNFHLLNRMLLFAPLLVVGGLAGCVTVDDETRQATQEREDIRIMQEQATKVTGRIEGLELETQKLRSDLDALRATQARSASASSDMQALHAELSDFDRRIRSMEAAREKDKQELVDVLSKKIALIVGGGAPADAGGRKKSGGGKSSSATKATAGTGGDYVVKSGDSLSAIAAAHGVTISALMEANGIKKANQIRAGQKLVIPQ